MNPRRLKGLYAGGQTEGRVKVDGVRIVSNKQSGGCLLRVASYNNGQRLLLVRTYSSVLSKSRDARICWRITISAAIGGNGNLICYYVGTRTCTLAACSSPQRRISTSIGLKPKVNLAPPDILRHQAKLLQLLPHSLLSSIMTALSTSARSTLCSSCIQRISGGDISQLWFPFHRQLRGKKKSTKLPTTINVKLLDDIKGFGRKGNLA